MMFRSLIAVCFAALVVQGAPALAHHKPGHGEASPFDARRDGAADIAAALERAKARGARMLAILGGDWCEDSVAIAAHVKDAAVAEAIAADYELVFVHIARRETDPGPARRFGVEALVGAPVVLVISSDGVLLNPDSIDAWRDAERRTPAEFAEWLARQAQATR